jgi:hypothetical protein
VWLAACGSLASAPAPRQPPKITFQETTYDFGRVEEGTQVRHAFAFRNAGGADLIIDNVRASCDCSGEVTSPRTLAPGDGGDIEVTFDTDGQRGSTTRTVIVYSNDPAQPVTTLALRGTIAADIIADPPELYVGHLGRGEAARSEVHLLVAGAVTVRGAEVTGRVVDAKLHAASGGTRLRIAIKPDAPAGRFKESVLVRTSSARRPVLTVPVIGIVEAGAR